MVATSSIKINSSMIDDFLTPVSDEENKNKYLKVNENNKIVYSSYDEIIADIETSGLDEKFNEINNRIDEEVLNLNNTISLETSKLESKDNYLETYIKNVEASAEEDADLFDAKINEINQTITDNYNTLDTKINNSVNDINSSLNTKANKNDVYTKQESDGKFATIATVNGKADKATTLAGYGITDAYTKTESDKKYVKTSGNETINGTKTFNNAIVLQNNGTTHKMTSYDATDDSTRGNIVIFQGTDKNNKMVSQLHNYVDYNEGNNRLCFEVNKIVGSENCNAALQLYIDNNNHFGISINKNSEATGYTTENNDALNEVSSSISDNSFGTKGWVNNPLKSTNVVHRTGDESIGGNKTFTGTVKVPTASVSSNDTSSVNTAYINTKFQKVNVLPANPDPNVYYFIPEV